ncbi:MAG: TIGR02757 family protein [Lentimicrobiaceae bacterium]|nr:TIGR02757 family protein [Lentimicrobiaceae bacterium]
MQLKDFLEQKYLEYNQPSFIPADPISIPHRFTLKEDIEIAGFLTAIIAWGNRKSILASANRLMEAMKPSPYQFIINYSPSVSQANQVKHFVHRTFNSFDLLFFFESLHNIYHQHGGLEAVFSRNINPESINVKDTITSFRDIFFELPHLHRTEKHLSNPQTGSAAKRINMFLRWMVRKDPYGVDFGIWNNIQPNQLCIPLDIHSGRVARRLGLLNRKQNDWKAVEELTAELKKFDPSDPVKYDFALFGTGVSEGF